MATLAGAAPVARALGTSPPAHRLRSRHGARRLMRRLRRHASLVSACPPSRSPPCPCPLSRLSAIAVRDRVGSNARAGDCSPQASYAASIDCSGGFTSLCCAPSRTGQPHDDDAMKLEGRASALHRPGSAAVPRQGKPGKLEITPTKPLTTQRDLSLAYSPGVAVPVLAIAEDPAARLRLHQQGQPGGGRLQRHGDPRPRQSRRAGGQAGDGRQGRAVQALRRHRRHRPPGRHRRTPTPFINCVRYLGPDASAASTWRTSRRRTASSSRRS